MHTLGRKLLAEINSEQRLLGYLADLTPRTESTKSEGVSVCEFRANTNTVRVQARDAPFERLTAKANRESRFSYKASRVRAVEVEGFAYYERLVVPS